MSAREVRGENENARKGGPVLAGVLVALLLAPAGLPVTVATVEAPILAPPIYTNVTALLGLGGFLNGGHLGEDDEGPMFPELSGPGACWLDADRDGRLDLYLTSGLYLTHPELNAQRDPHSRLYRNTGTGFVENGGRLVGTYQGCSAADYDNDGWTDLYVAGYGGGALLHNEQGTLVDRAPALGVVDAVCPLQVCWGTSASWLDYDRDACLDLYVGHFGDFDINDPGPADPDFTPPQANRLYRGTCGGAFTDVTVAAGLSVERRHTWGTLGVDLNDDVWPDIYVCNDAGLNDLYVNQHNGTFVRVTGTLDDPRHCMGSAIGDIDRDGTMDVTTSNYVGEHNGVFLGRSTASYVDLGDDPPFTDAFAYSAWATTIADLDQDSRPDVMFVNGLTQTGINKPPAEEPMWLYLQRGAGAFVQARELVGADFVPHVAARGAAWADFDDDGDLDILVAEAGASPTHLFRADATSGNFLLVDLLGGAGMSRDAIGARVRVVPDGLPAQTRDRTAGDGFLSSSDPRLHFGLGLAESATVHVRWPDGSTQTIPDVRANSAIRATHGIADAQTLWTRPIVRVTGPTEVRWNATTSWEASAPPGEPAFESASWTFDGATVVDGFSVEHKFRTLGEAYARVHAVDASGVVKTQSLLVHVTDDLQATITPERAVTPPGETPRARLHVAHSDGTPLAGAVASVEIRYAAGEPQDSTVAELPKAARTALGYVTTWVNGTTDAQGNLAIEVPTNVNSPITLARWGTHAIGEYTLVATGQARGIVFPTATATLRVGVEV